MRWRAAGALAALAALAAPTTALAFQPTGVTAAPATTQAGANSDFTLHFGIDEPARNLKGFVVHLPPGQVGAVTATPLCTQAQFAAKACPATTQVGTTTTTATLLGAPLPLTIPGVLYNLQPIGSEPARLGIRLTPTVGDEILLQSVITVRAADGGLDSSVDGLPNTAAGIPIQVTAVDITLLGKAGSPTKGFMANPTSCAPATTKVDVFAYDGSSGSGSASFTPTGCDRLAFAPTLTAAFAGSAKGTHPQLTTVVEQTPPQANTRSVAVTLPAGIGVVQAALARACPAAQLAANACPASAQVGTAKAQTPVLTAPLQGPVLLVTPPTGPLPELVVVLHGPISLQLHATVAFAAGGRLQSTFDGIPDTPLSRFTLTLAGGASGILGNGRDLCGAPPLRVDGAFVAHDGATATTAAIADVSGCAAPAPKASARLTGVRSRHPVLLVRFAAAAGSRLRSVGLSLPRALRLNRAARARRAITVLAGGRKVKRPRLRATTTSLTASGLPKGGSGSVQLRLRRGALRLARALRVGQRVTLALSFGELTGAHRKITLRVRAAR